ncbi:MAG: FkbM family methyltransferase [Oscillospiraceae bacterium]|jgi:FkbM family methyltransferase|nr:FkbM family methyltransferase [Oscillospiraceae bacterium]MCI2034894.1 FkbM family methyltransferase [Oscillospiraceae bacterium]
MLGSFEEEYAKIEGRYRSGRDSIRLSKLKRRLLSRPIVLFGLGFYGVPAYRNFVSHGIIPKCFCDSKKSGCEKETGLPIVSPTQLQQEYPHANIVISVANPDNQKSIFRQVRGLGFDEQQIFTFDSVFQFLDKSVVEVTSLTFDEFQKHLAGYRWSYNFFSDDGSKRIVLERINSYLFKDILHYKEKEPAYFPRDLFSFSEKEVFVDGGLYTGDTSEAFIKLVNGKYRAVFGFDIDEANASRARQNLSQYENVHIITKGLWSKTDVLHAKLKQLAGSQINQAGTVSIPVISLDEYFSNTNVENFPTFIKMDIEGSEKHALLGSKNIISTVRPKLAVCAYHKPEDIYDLPQTILKIRRDYKFALRHYSPYTWETVLYAY